ncbi:hypothetical protein AKJ46_00240 [candidate division MSBL1 archaeon SCGC-AAA833K04]|uniref:Uncharacterized protein n=1 Tax=candidate division MSBL1 archaeon SCGC-AAA833K04 TaxID=1698258 RepID=A0A133VST4_9EURY|nr:hypothetical protein AKJ46_00240 [candidate division MSBL1 archaeon SCGC-AAA833K04]
MTTINLFHAHDAYIFKHYFDDRNLFEELRQYYDSLEYRFEVGESEVESVIENIELGDEKALVMKDMVAKEEALDRGRVPDEEWRKRL